MTTSLEDFVDEADRLAFLEWGVVDRPFLQELAEQYYKDGTPMDTPKEFVDGLAEKYGWIYFDS